jgi:1-acyl-sn-glycerol-3-phosphate acyltransferase
MYKIIAAIARTILFVNGAKAKVYNKENVPTEGGFVIACTHTGYVDIFNLAASIYPREIHFMAKKQLFEIKGLGWLIRNLNAFPVDRENPGPSVIKIPRQLIKDGKIVGIFPSGTRTTEATNLKQGAVTIAQLSKSQIVPAAYVGPKDFKGMFRREKAYLIYGEPFTIESGKEEREAAGLHLEAELLRLTAELEKIAAADKK